jgi:hypothetical protein
MELIELLINLGIALISIDIGVYAIANTFLSKQIKRNILYANKRLLEAKDNIDEKIKRKMGNLDEIQGEITKTNNEIKNNKQYLNSVMIKNAVILPSISLIISILLLVFLNKYDLLNELLKINIFLMIITSISIITFFYGVYKIYKTLLAIEFASLNIPLPIFDVYFRNDEKSLTIESDVRTIEVVVSNEGYEIGEMTELSLFFPPEIKLKKSHDYTITKQTENEQYANYNGVFIDVGTVYINSSIGYDIYLTQKQIPNRYIIHTQVNAKDIIPVDNYLILEIK